LSFGAADPAGATGVQADLAAFSALSCTGLAVTTALLIGDSARVEDMQDIDPDWVADQARVLLEDMTMAAFKVGAITNLEQVAAIAEILSDYPDAPLILDPFSSRLPALSDDDAEDLLTAIRQLLVPQATLLMLSQVELGRLAETWREAETTRNDERTTPAVGRRAPAGLGLRIRAGDRHLVRQPGRARWPTPCSAPMASSATTPGSTWPARSSAPAARCRRR
jgi:hydroxymethylpyrimidine/phosphomethylpyrimidine kinase